MNDKEIQVIETALRFYAAKGYTHTSMNEIATSCGISKGSLYNMFSSKEALFVTCFQYFNQLMYEKALAIKSDSSLSPKEILVEQLSMIIGSMVERKVLVSLMLKEVSLKDKQEIIPFMQHIKKEVTLWQKDMLCEAYGSSLSKFSWNAIIFLQGMLKEYIMVLIESESTWKYEQAAAFIVAQLDHIIEQLEQQSSPPLISEDIMEQFHSGTNHHNEATLTLEQQLAKATLSLKSQLLKLNKTEYLDSFQLIEEEMQQAEPRSFLIKALLTYMEQEPAIAQEWKHFKSVTNEWLTKKTTS
ncbi:TetR/AcrR family transcriptional regulator [Longirhabdus pacifica]|uniref:TetR/AcrR family transcriptional regulator n=1 Tax=Longirhabdus pacifica TaxID=2305227 RepID=UPI00100874FC|nr:TetR/AcrR family transcriptional regulator [Longirhabdus pacifica]